MINVYNNKLILFSLLLSILVPTTFLFTVKVEAWGAATLSHRVYYANRCDRSTNLFCISRSSGDVNRVLPTSVDELNNNEFAAFLDVEGEKSERGEGAYDPNRKYTDEEKMALFNQSIEEAKQRANRGRDLSNRESAYVETLKTVNKLQQVQIEDQERGFRTKPISRSRDICSIVPFHGTLSGCEEKVPWYVSINREGGLDLHPSLNELSDEEFAAVLHKDSATKEVEPEAPQANFGRDLAWSLEKRSDWIRQTVADAKSGSVNLDDVSGPEKDALLGTASALKDLAETTVTQEEVVDPETGSVSIKRCRRAATQGGCYNTYRDVFFTGAFLGISRSNDGIGNAEIDSNFLNELSELDEDELTAFLELDAELARRSGPRGENLDLSPEELNELAYEQLKKAREGGSVASVKIGTSEDVRIAFRNFFGISRSPSGRTDRQAKPGEYWKPSFTRDRVKNAIERDPTLISRAEAGSFIHSFGEYLIANNLTVDDVPYSSEIVEMDESMQDSSPNFFQRVWNTIRSWFAS